MSYSVVIVGAGLVGSLTALALAEQGVTVTVLEQQQLDLTKLSQRPISLNYFSMRLLSTLQLWDELATVSTAIDCVHVSKQGCFGQIEFSAAEYRVPALGFVVPYASLYTALFTALQQHPAITLEYINDVERLDNHEAYVQVNDRQVDAVIAADGSDSRCRELLGIAVSEEDQGEVAYTGILTLSQAHSAVAYERFTEQGTLALLPLADTKKMAVVWTTATEQALSLEMIQTMMATRLGVFTDFKATSHYPLRTVQAVQALHGRVLLMGNAMHTLYPLAAQGFNLAVRDVAALRHSWPDLAEYGRLQQADQVATSQLTQLIAELFHTDGTVMRLAQQAALLTAQHCGPVKDKIAQRTIGLNALALL